MRIGDSNREIVESVKLKHGATLHRFKNAAGNECSAIYVGDNEIWWHYRSEEERMVKEWNRRWSDSE